MHLVSCHHGELQILTHPVGQKKPQTFTTGLKALDNLLPNHAFPRGVIHEALSHPGSPLPLFFAALLARSAISPASPFPTSPLPPSPTKAIIWCDPTHLLYPPALAAAGIPLDRLWLLRPTNPADLVWAVTESLRCRGVAVTVANIQDQKLSRIQARRLQLAAETGGGAAILIRTLNKHSNTYAAATRWLVSPAPGERTLQRWKVQLIHGHGGCVGQSIILEACRETHLVRAFETVADRPLAQNPPARRKWA